jgi:FkbM family methyltransferase
MIFKGNPFSEFADCIENYFKHYSLKEGDSIVDGGAYTGAFTVYCAKLIGENGRVISFEPDTKNFKVLLENIKLNKVEDRVILLQKGLWGLKSRLSFNQGGKGARLDFERNIKTNNSFINLNSLDNELSELKIKKIDFIKFDIEGAEIEALDGSKKTLKENKCPIAIASYHLRNGGKTSKICEEKLRKLGLKTETVVGRHTTTYGF